MTTAATKAARVLAKLGASKGGKASAAKLTPAQRKKRARKAARARWKAWRDVKASAASSRLSSA